MSWSEVEKPSIEIDWFGRVTARRFFRVWNFDPQALRRPTTIIGGPNLQGLPDYGTQFDTFTDTRLRRYSANGNSLVFDAVAEYSTFAEDELLRGSFQTETISYPLAKLLQAKITGGDTVYRWDTEGTGSDFATMERLYIKRRRTIQYSDWRKTVADQVGMLHNIGGVWYRFESPDFTMLSSTVFEFDYSFVSDSGNRTIRLGNTGESNPQSVIRVPPPTQRFTELTGDQTWARPPFCELHVANSVEEGTPNILPPDPIFTYTCKYEISTGSSGNKDGLGWLLMPGLEFGI